MKIWNELSGTQRGFTVVVLSIVAVLALLMLTLPTAYQNSVVDHENLVLEAVKSCGVTIDNGVKAVVELAQVDTNTKEFIKGVFEEASRNPNSQLAKDVDGAYVQFVQGNTTPMMLLMGGLTGTDITMTSQNVQREISAQRSAMAACSIRLVNTQKQLRGKLGYDASNMVTKFPQKHMNLQLANVADSNLRDNDFDGHITVLDYLPPVDPAVMESFGTGVSEQPIDVYGENE